MKVCLTNRCSSEYLSKADEIKFKYKDRNAIIDCVGKYNATIVLDGMGTVEVDWENIKHLKTLCKDNFIFAASDVEQVLSCIEHEIDFYYNKPISTWADLNTIVDYHPKYVLIAAPLFFQLRKVKDRYDTPVRAVPNLAYFSSFPLKDGLFGSWIRPNDIDLYEGLIDTIEFYSKDATSEQASYRVYCVQKDWPLELGRLICNFVHKGVENKYLPRSMTEARINCKQRCLSDSMCNICERAAILSKDKNFQERLSRNNDIKEHNEVKHES